MKIVTVQSLKWDQSENYRLKESGFMCFPPLNYPLKNFNEMLKKRAASNLVPLRHL